MGRESAQYLTVIAESRAADYSAFGTMALEYDSNVTLGPSPRRCRAPSAARATGVTCSTAAARWTPVHWGGASLSVSYEFFQSLQFQLTDFNLKDNRPALQLQYDFDWVSLGLLGRYDYYLLDGDSYLSEFTGMPWVTVREEGLRAHRGLLPRIQPRRYFKAGVQRR